MGILRNYLNLSSFKPRTKIDIIHFLTNHKTYRGGYFSHNVKISHLHDLSHAEVDACYAALENEFAFFQVNDYLKTFTTLHPSWLISFEGRSQGHMVLVREHGNSDYDSGEDYSEWEWSDLRWMFQIVWDFDQACQEAIDIFVDYAYATYQEEEPA